MQSAESWIWTGETYDFEFEAREAGKLELEFRQNPTALITWKVAQVIEIE